VLLCIDLEPDQLYPVPGQEETWEGSRAAFAWAKRWRAAGPGGHINWFRQMDDSILERHGANGPEVLFRDELAPAAPQGTRSGCIFTCTGDARMAPGSTTCRTTRGSWPT